MATQHLGNLPLDLKRHFSLHVGCTLVISHRYLRPGIEASFLLASAYTTSSRVLLRQHPSGPQLRRPVLSEGLGAFVGRVGSSATLCLALAWCPVLSPTWPAFHVTFCPRLLNSHGERAGGCMPRPPCSYVFASLRAQTGREAWTPCFGRK